MTIKDFFMFSISVTLLCLCCAGCFYLWKNEREKQQALENEQIIQQLLLEKRQKSDEFYISEFIRSGVLTRNDLTTCFAGPRLENNMVQDGYTHAEIGAIKDRARFLLRLGVKN